LAARCRERFATDPTILTSTAEPGPQEPPTTAHTGEVETVVPQESLDTTAT
jgi:hypothetical protein